MKAARLLPIAISSTLAIAACSSDNADVRTELTQLTADLKPRVDTLPAKKELGAFKFEAFDVPDPFQPWKQPPKVDAGARRDRMLLARYANPAEIQAARAAAQAEAARRVKDAENRLPYLTKRLATLRKELEFFKGDNKPPARLLADIGGAEAELKAHEDALAARKKELAAVDAQYDEIRNRYAQLAGRRK